jgi:hypothetical protein
MFAPVSICAQVLAAMLALAPTSVQRESVSTLQTLELPSTTIASSSDCTTTLSNAEAREFLRALLRVQYQIRVDLGRLRRLAIAAMYGPYPPGFLPQADTAAQRLIQSIDATARAARFGSMHIADGSVSWVCIQIAPTDASGVRFSMDDCTAHNQQLDSIELTTAANANLALDDIDAAIWGSEFRGRYLGLVSALLNGSL